MKQSLATLSVVVPVYNESAAIAEFHRSLVKVLQALPMRYEILYVDDGSQDGSTQAIGLIAADDRQVRLLRLSRNFGKEVATTAGLHAATGDAVMMIDADGQHPVMAIPSFVEKWQAGAKVVVGLPSDRRAGWLKRTGSRLFYGIFRQIAGFAIDPEATDFRLIDRSVQLEFNRLNERNRITRGLIDWLGYDREHVEYQENPRLAGTATYPLRKLLKLAVDSAISLSTSPLYLVSYIGAVVLPVATLLGLGMLINAAVSDPLHLHASGAAYLTVLILWLIGVLLVSQGIIGLYLSHIHTETQGRPLYIIDTEHSLNIK